jgi:hypothetical protein
MCDKALPTEIDRQQAFLIHVGIHPTSHTVTCLNCQHVNAFKGKMAGYTKVV